MPSIYDMNRSAFINTVVDAVALGLDLEKTIAELRRNFSHNRNVSAAFLDDAEKAARKAVKAMKR